MKKMVKVLVIVMVVCLIPSFCFAAGAGFYTCHCRQHRDFSGRNFCLVNRYSYATPAFTNECLFYLDSTGTNTKSLLATALTAISLGKTCRVYVNTISRLWQLHRRLSNPLTRAKRHGFRGSRFPLNPWAGRKIEVAGSKPPLGVGLVL